MLKKIKRLLIVLIIIFSFTSVTTIAEESFKRPLFVKPDDITIEKEVDRARKTVNMIDDMYKTFIVLTTEEYVQNPTTCSALILSKKVFEVMTKKGWHEARLLSTFDTPHNPDNFPKDDFERDAIEAIVSGNTYHEKVEEIDDKHYLRSATSVIAFMDGCTMCHPDKKVGDLLGAISYRIPLD